MTAKIELSRFCDADRMLPSTVRVDQSVKCQIDFHRSEIRRYSRMLATGLNEIELKYVHDRIAERYATLNQILAASGDQIAA